ncbi:hypothetical protein CSKR_112866, partial [Clonorchis sinensis]
KIENFLFHAILKVNGARWPKWLEREFTDRKIRGSNTTSFSLGFHCAGLSNLAVSQSPSFFLVARQLGAERMLQLNDRHQGEWYWFISANTRACQWLTVWNLTSYAVHNKSFSLRFILKNSLIIYVKLKIKGTWGSTFSKRVQKDVTTGSSVQFPNFRVSYHSLSSSSNSVDIKDQLYMQSLFQTSCLSLASLGFELRTSDVRGGRVTTATPTYARLF